MKRWLRKPDGTIEEVTPTRAGWVSHAVPAPPGWTAERWNTMPGATCWVLPGRVCRHGYRCDDKEQHHQGDGCPVVALEPNLSAQELRWHFGPEWLPAHRDGVAAVLGLEPETEVEVLLNDTRVVRTRTRCPVVGSDVTAQVQLHGFLGPYSITRVRLSGAHWGHPLNNAGRKA